MSENYEPRSPREAELVLSPNEFAYVLDKTKGHVTTWVGPTKTSLSNTDSPVIFDLKSFSFVEVPLTKAIQKLTVIPESWYGQLKNPADNHPKIGNANSSADLKTGQKVNVKGPASFALYPGQMIRVIRGHSLRSNQYLIVRIYDDSKLDMETLSSAIPAITEETELAVGKQFVIKGTEMAFFIPPDGIEVVREGDSYIREALTLEQLEYCILLDENGDKRFVQGPAVVFPTVTETFVMNGSNRSFHAFELTPTSGIYVKVTADYEENGTRYKTGQELFITGKEQMIYFPRKEHTIIRYAKQSINYATAVPAGDARYLLNKNTGEVTTQIGPAMILPDPRNEVFINRILTAKECALLFPGNRDVLSHNSALYNMSDNGAYYAGPQLVSTDVLASTINETVNQKFDRGTVPHKPHSITIENKFDGAVKFNVWTGYAVQIVKGDERRVVIGPAQVILDYDETIEILSLSSGRPKTTDNLIETAFLRYSNNKVSDIINAQTADFVTTNIKVSFLVNFDPAESDKWFAVDNYVKLLSDRVRSKVKRMVKSMNIREFYAQGYDLIRRKVLGDEGSAGMYFEENGMTIADIDVLSISIDDDVELQLESAASRAFSDSLALDALKSQAEMEAESLEYQKQLTKLQIAKAISKLEVKQAEMESQDIITNKLHNRAIEEAEHEAFMEAEKLRAKIEADNLISQSKIQRDINLHEAELAARKAKADQELAQKKEEFELQKTTEEHNLAYLEQSAEIEKGTLAAQAEAQKLVLNAIDPHLTTELKRVADTNENFRIADTLAKNLAPTSLIAGKSMADILVELSKGTVYQDIFSGFGLTVDTNIEIEED